MEPAIIVATTLPSSDHRFARQRWRANIDLLVGVRSDLRSSIALDTTAAIAMGRKQPGAVPRWVDVLGVQGLVVAKEVLALPRAAAISDEDATQFMHAIHAALMEHLEGGSTVAHDLLLEGMRSLAATGSPSADGVRGVSRYCLLLAARVAAALPPEERAKAEVALAIAASDLLHDIVADGSESAREFRMGEGLGWR